MRRVCERLRRFSRWRFTWRRTSSAVAWIAAMTSGEDSRARNVTPFR
jgi:hypothetical protein